MRVQSNIIMSQSIRCLTHPREDSFFVDNPDREVGAAWLFSFVYVPARKDEDRLDMDFLAGGLGEELAEEVGGGFDLVQDVRGGLRIDAGDYELVILVADFLVTGAGLAEGFSFDGKDAGGPDQGVVDVERRVLGVGDVVQDAVAVLAQVFEQGADGSLAVAALFEPLELSKGAANSEDGKQN